MLPNVFVGSLPYINMLSGFNDKVIEPPVPFRQFSLFERQFGHFSQAKRLALSVLHAFQAGWLLKPPQLYSAVDQK